MHFDRLIILFLRDAGHLAGILFRKIYKPMAFVTKTLNSFPYYTIFKLSLTGFYFITFILMAWD